MSNPSPNIQSVSLPKQGETVAMQQNVKLSVDEVTTISRSKLEHLKDLADDDRMKESGWGIDRIITLIAEMLVLTPFGLLLSSSQLSEAENFLCKSLLGIGLLLCVIFMLRERAERSKREAHRERLKKRISQIIDSIEPKN